MGSKVTSRQSQKVSFTLRLVLSTSEGSLSSLQRATWTARPVGTHVNKDTTSNDTRVSSSARICEEMNSTKDFEFWT